MNTQEEEMNTQREPIPGGDPRRGGAGATAVDPTRRPAAEPVVAQPQPRADVGPVRETRPVMRDRIRWGPVWAGLVVALATYLLLQLILVAVNAVEVVEPGTNDAVISGIAAAVAFVLGGITAGATAQWKGADDGILHGVVLWATGLVAIVILSAVGSGLALGAIDSSDAFDDLTNDEVDTVAAREDSQDAAGMALVGITGALIASVVGGAVGSKMWPRRDDTIDLRDAGASNWR